MVAAIGFKEVLWSLSICFLLALATKILFASLFVLKDARDKAGVWNAEVESLNDEQIRSGGEVERWRGGERQLESQFFWNRANTTNPLFLVSRIYP